MYSSHCSSLHVLIGELEVLTLHFLHSVTSFGTFLVLRQCLRMNPFEEVVLVFK